MAKYTASQVLSALMNSDASDVEDGEELSSSEDELLAEQTSDEDHISGEETITEDSNESGTDDAPCSLVQPQNRVGSRVLKRRNSFREASQSANQGESSTSSSDIVQNMISKNGRVWSAAPPVAHRR